MELKRFSFFLYYYYYFFASFKTWTNVHVHVCWVRMFRVEADQRFRIVTELNNLNLN